METKNARMRDFNAIILVGLMGLTVICIFTMVLIPISVP
jgi:hypothetical protein